MWYSPSSLFSCNQCAGWSVALPHFVLVPLTGCGINPGRSLGPHLVIIFAGEKAGTEGWWVYYTAPFVGAAVAVGVCKVIFDVKFGGDDDETHVEHAASAPEEPEKGAPQSSEDAEKEA